ncbi:hypothetical protein LCI18_001972 [Fusarium solani-melongenae]|uniref:Uncharacterized protein n=1 Tax=Fusarium solani subsp. cucurbitae TaxID=2747967 RepID=A0ACD3YPV7_FUSSC|nr:hypothetical protein LCI18_001972 [Fusarium solani-melongenae]
MPQPGHNSNSASPPLSPHHSFPVIANNSQHIFGVSVGEYSQKGRRALQICPSYKSRIVAELFSLVALKEIPIRDKLSTDVRSLADGTFLPLVEGELWTRCGLDFPGLAHLHPTWAKLVVHIAKELAANVKNAEGVVALLHTALTMWWKQGNAQRAKLKMGEAGASVKSEVTYQPSIKADVLDFGVLPGSSAGLGLEKT